MLAEWNRWLEGISSFKAGQGILWVFVLGLLVLLWRKSGQEQQRLAVLSAVMGFLVLCPLSAVVLLKGFTPFYDWLDLQQLFPMPLWMALFAMTLGEAMEGINIPGIRAKGYKGYTKTAVAYICVGILLLTATNFHGFDEKAKADSHGVPVGTAEAFDALYELVGDTHIVLAAKGDILQYTRLYEPSWQPLYGRDLWSGKSASYINSGYDVEYAYYSLLERTELAGEDQEEFIALLAGGEADCIIVPYYWREAYSQIPGYELLILTEEYNIIIKKDLIAG